MSVPLTASYQESGGGTGTVMVCATLSGVIEGIQTPISITLATSDSTSGIYNSLVPRLSMGGWRRAWYTLIADLPTFPRGFLSQCVTMCNNDILIVYIAKSVDSKNTAKT